MLPMMTPTIVSPYLLKKFSFIFVSKCIKKYKIKFQRNKYQLENAAKIIYVFLKY